MKQGGILSGVFFLLLTFIGAQDSDELHYKAVALLESRGNRVHESPEGLVVVLTPQVGDQEVTVADIAALNQLRNVVELRIVASEGITPEVFETLNPIPGVRRVTIHYRMPKESIRFLDRFPNLERLQFWADSFVSCEELPGLQKLRIIHHESTEGEFSLEAVKRIASCKNLEEISILRPVTEEGVRLLKSLPNWKKIEVNGTVIQHTESK
jgi:hypothetical protein